MSEPPLHELPPAAPVFDAEHPPPPAVARLLLDECHVRFAHAMHDAARGSIETTDDLYEGVHEVSDNETLNFRSRRGEWVERFGRTLAELYSKRMSGKRRKGRRLDTDVSASTLRVLTPFDFEKQSAISRATQRLQWASRRELPALTLRVGVLLREDVTREVDNPFAPEYVLDAVGATSRALFPNPRMWRPLMECILTDITPALSKVYITLNRYLADRHVLPEIKASLRARSELRPPDDSELLPLFTKMMNELNAPPGPLPQLEIPAGLGEDAARAAAARPPAQGPVATAPPPAPLPAAAGATSVTPPDSTASRSSLPAAPVAGGAAPAPVAAAAAGPPAAVATAPESAGAAGAADDGAVPLGVPPAVAQAFYAAFARFAARAAHEPPPVPEPDAGGFGFPQLDSMMTLGSSSNLIAALEQWQRFEPHMDEAWRATAPAGTAVQAPPLNRIPMIRDAVSDAIVNPSDRITMDVIALLFDYIFRDPSIPEAQREIFARLQVPIAKAALLDRSFFTERKHPARKLLDHLASAAVGSTSDDNYRTAFESIAQKVVAEVNRDFRIDVDVFADADAKLQPFVDSEQAGTARALTSDVADALAAEQREQDRAEVRVLLRDKLAGLDLPFEVRSFVETIWGDYLTSLRVVHGEASAQWKTALATLDDLLWSISAKERNAQKARLTRMIPTLVRALRTGCTALAAGGERVHAFFETLYRLHIAVLRPAPPVDQPEPGAAGASAPSTPIGNLHDFVNEMVVGTWLAFDRDDGTVNARLFWVSPLRTKYIFTSRGRAQAFAFTPEELAYQIGAGRARLVLEPVPLFDRAVSAALDTLAARTPRAA